MSDNIAVLDGYTVEIHACNTECELFLLVKPDEDLDSRFRAWDTDEQEYIYVNGWMFHCEERA